jgi:DNA-binding transcriptional LysR family regulator
MRYRGAVDLDELRAFVAVVDSGSLAAAAKSLRFPIATLRRRLDELEARMGVKLLERDRQGAAPTRAGTILMRRARGLLSDVQSLTEVVRWAGSDPAGEVSVALPVGILPGPVAVFLELVGQHHPKVDWNLRVVEHPTTALSEGAHAAVVMGDAAPSGPWVARRLATLPERLMASEAYLDRHGVPTSTSDLAHHRLLLWNGGGRTRDEVPLANGGRLPVAPAIRMNDLHLVSECAASGVGIGFIPKPTLFTLERDLVPVLEDEVQGTISLWLLAPPSLLESPALSALFDHLSSLTPSFVAK